MEVGQDFNTPGMKRVQYTYKYTYKANGGSTLKLIVNSGSNYSSL